MPTVSESLVATLAAAGVKRVYGIVGDSLNGITDAMRRHKTIECVHVRHEEVAAFAAGADAHVTGELAVCAGSCGPGNLHLINGLFDCHRSSVPVLAIAAQIPSSEIGSDYFQETHPESLFKECSYYCQLVSTPAQMPRALEIAMTTAIARRGVAVIVLSGDVATQSGEHLEATTSYRKPVRPLIRPLDSDLDRLAELLNGSDRVTLLCGAGCAGAHDELLKLGDALKAPMVHALRGKEYVEYYNPYESVVPWEWLVEDYSRIRDKIEAVLPIFQGFNARIKIPGGFRLANPASERIWMTPTGRANFIVFPGLDEDLHQNNPDVLWLSTLRSHDQYNSTIYSNNDRYRGIYNQRDVLFLNDKEIKRRGLAPEARVDIHTMSSDGIDRVVHGFKIVPYNIPDGSCAAYYPETNPLLPLNLHDPISGTPSAKGIPVVLKPNSATRS
jgi:hypothetical protein